MGCCSSSEANITTRRTSVLELVFEQLDRDNSGSLTIAEWRTLVTTQGLQDSVFAMVDANGDSMLSMEE